LSQAKKIWNLKRIETLVEEKTNNYYWEAINRAIEYIESNYTNSNLNLNEIADRALLSKYHFHRVFKSIIGSTAKDYVVRLRLEKSAQLLKLYDRTISDIAFDCGYNSPETYNRAFKKYFSVSPTLFRQNSKEWTKMKRSLSKYSSNDSLSISFSQITEVSDLNLAYIRHFGRYQEVGKSFQKLMAWAAIRGVLKLRPKTIGIAYDNPDLTEEHNLRFDACILVSKETQPKGRVGYKKISGGKFAVFSYEGSYSALDKVYDDIYYKAINYYNWELRDEPLLEWYMKRPSANKPEQALTNIYLPIN